MERESMLAGQGADGLPAFPFKILVASEFSPRVFPSGASLSAGPLRRIDRLSFDSVFAELAPRVTLDVRDRLSDSRGPKIVTLQLENLRSLGPDCIADQIPATRDLIRLCGAMKGLREAKIGLAELRSLLASFTNRSNVLESVERALAPRAVPSSPPPSGDLDALLDMVETPSSAAARGAGADASRLDALIRTLVQSAGRSERVDGRAVEAAIGEIDAAVSSQVDEVLHHPEFRRLEATWCGLKLLVERTDFERPIMIELLATDREHLLERFDSLVYEPESASVSVDPVSLVVLDFEFGRSPADLDLLRALSERAAVISTPILAPVGPPFFGVDRAGALEAKVGLRQEFAGPEFAKWKGLRESDHARWLGLIANRFLLRPDYGSDGGAARTFRYTESLPQGSEDDLRLWGNPAWVVASLAARSFARLGWCTDMMGQRAAGTAQDLPVRTRTRRGAEPTSHPLEMFVTDEIERDLSSNGLMTLSAPYSCDRACLRFAPAVHAPAHYPDPTDNARAKLQSTIPFQMFVGRVIQYVLALQGPLADGRATDQVLKGYDQALRGLLATAGPVPQDAVVVEAVPNDEDPSATDLYMRIRWPGGQSLPGAGEFEIRFPLAG